ncbi:precorrin-6y C5,15-methyltransferase (decarboxylating) subunit CbiE [Prevotella sp. E13-17]|uniref:precorrin-6y C5,15-methyltransferase (decarboxylating) subunit CbiE n=1 Tax=Prevotella sp. E13-17 TaxID=2913616 RepID=UPI001EDC2410|nr:precorrin-6y C5,15-methyltransferase (decarboxylating) subunit CbiE [Prevotella sp. E13-17]UKK51696.1 precorrin-6y C5,15-methyltransferase (decarboxylating) subunit CbiE [Prevotella sp. E13-17]
MKRASFIVIGITDHPAPWFPPEVLDIIRQGKIFSGGRRHHEIVAPLLPADAEWIDITIPLDNVFEQYRAFATQVIIFASGDPLFFGFANTIRREMPDAELLVYPAFNSLQLLAHRLLLPYHDMRIVSLTGRPWPQFDRALIERTEKIGILTDREHTPTAIAQRMLEYGYNNYIMNIGEHLGNPQLETVSTCSLEEAAKKDFSTPNCLILTTPLPRREGLGVGLLGMGLPDSAFALLDGREKMITKMPIRLLTLQALDLGHRHTLWDIGACTGSVSIEARLLFPHLQVEAFEIRPECETIIQENMHHFGAPGINIHIGDFLTSHLSPLTSPDAVFIGGHGGHLKEIMQKVLTVLAPNGIIVMNSVKAPRVITDSHQLWDEACRELGLRQDPPLYIQLNDHHPITILKCRR